MTTYWTDITGTPIGTLRLTAAAGGALTGVHMETDPRQPGDAWVRDDESFTRARAQLAEYFTGDRQEFDLDLEPAGTEFQRMVWKALLTIPYGEVRSYGEIAEQIGKPGAARAVGLANGRNPIAVIVPCHRVIGASGHLTGYGGGLDRKRYLLDLEQQAAQPALIP